LWSPRKRPILSWREVVKALSKSVFSRYGSEEAT
jgi:hypothetical protein